MNIGTPSRRQLLTRALATGLVTPAMATAARAGGDDSAKAMFERLMVRGSFPVKTANPLSFVLPEDKRTLLVRVSYPGADPAGTQKFPAVVFSHGELSSKDLYAAIADHWASHGIVTILPTHFDSASLGYSRGAMKDADILAGRVADLSYLVDNLQLIAETAPGLAGHMDLEHAAIGGHGLGVLAALATAGLPFKRADGSTVTKANARVKAVISYNGCGPLPVADTGWDSVTVPVFASACTADAGVMGDTFLQSWRWRLSPYTMTHGLPRYGLSITDGDHSYGGLIEDAQPGAKPDATGLAIVNALSTAFVAAQLLADSASAAFLKSADVPHLTHDRAFLERVLR